MLSKDTMPDEYLDQVKRHLSVTWKDTDTDDRIEDMMLDAEVALNHMLGAEADYFKPGLDHELYLAYLLYAWNNCLNEFDAAYRTDIIRARHLHAYLKESGT